MEPDDPFGSGSDSNRTIIRPSPGRRPRQQTNAPSGTPKQPIAAPPPSRHAPGRSAQGVAPTAGVLGDSATPAGALLGAGLNPLLDAASGLLVLAPELRKTLSQNNPAQLYGYVGQQIKVFEATAKSSGYAPETVLDARYVLCAFVDEAVLGTPWGSESHWSSRSLLSAFHHENTGGERFFDMLTRLLEMPAQNLDILELMYVCLALGFQGKYGIDERGHSKLMDIQDNLYTAISRQKGDFERELAPRWQGVPDRRNRLVKYVPLWVVCALAGVLLLVLYSSFNFILSQSSKPVYTELRDIIAAPGPH